MDYIHEANEFLERNNIALFIDYCRHDSMKWDTDGTKRNIYQCKLESDKGAYVFDFGDCVHNSNVNTQAEMNYEIEIDHNKEYDVFLGFSLKHSTKNLTFYFYHDQKFSWYNIKNLTCPNKIEGEIFNLLHEKAKSFWNQTTLTGEQKKMWIDRTIDMDLKIIITNALKRKYKKVISDHHSKYVQSKIKKRPSNYDVLSCLNVSYFDDPDDVYDMFGQMKPSQAIEIYEEDEKLREILTEEQIQELNDIS